MMINNDDEDESEFKYKATSSYMTANHLAIDMLSKENVNAKRWRWPTIGNWLLSRITISNIAR